MPHWSLLGLLVVALLPMVAHPAAPLVAPAVVVLLVDRLVVLAVAGCLVALGALLMVLEFVVALLKCFLQWGLILASQRVQLQPVQ